MMALSARLQMWTSCCLIFQTMAVQIAPKSLNKKEVKESSKTCSTEGPNAGILGSSGSCDGVGWPESYNTVEECHDRCVGLSDCGGYHYYGSGDSAYTDCYLHKHDFLAGQDADSLDSPLEVVMMDDGRNRYAGVCLYSPPTPAPTPCDETTGTCTVVEDPHIVVFDGGQVSLFQNENDGLDSMQSGDKWLVKSAKVSIQARLKVDEGMMEQREFVRAIAIGGPFLKGNIITVGSLEDSITWNGKPILEDQNETSSFHFNDGDVSVLIKRSPHSSNVADLSKENPGIDIKLPKGVSLIVNRLSYHLSAAITMPQQKDGQEGLCGNFNGIEADDSLEMASKRDDPNVPNEESLFAGVTFA